VGPSTGIDELRAYLSQPDTQRTLAERLQRVQRDLSTSIKEAAEFAGLTEPQVRYIEARGLLRVGRSRRPEQPEAATPGRRRYGLSELRRLVLIGILEEQFSLAEIGEQIEELDRDVLQYPSAGEEEPTVTEKIVAAERHHFNRFFVSRALYLALRLLGGNPIAGNMGIFLPAPEHPDEAPPRAESVHDLGRAGQILWGWLGRDHPFCTFLSPTVRIESPDLYDVISIDRQAQPDGEHRLGAYLVQEKSASLVMRGPATEDEERRQRDARIAAWQFLRTLKFAPEEGAEPYWTALHPSNAGVEYNSYQFVSAPLLGDSLLQRMAEAIVHLGGRDPRDPTRWRWHFSVILEPYERDRTVQETPLVVRAQSARSPHQIGITMLQPARDPGISLDAFQSGTIIKRTDISSADPRIAFYPVEGDIRSAIAVPIQSARGERLAVIYVVSQQPQAFSRADEIMLRAVGRMAEEIIAGMRARDLPPEQMTMLITNPEYVDTFFTAFPTENEFITDIAATITQMEEQCQGEGRGPAAQGEEESAEHDIERLSLIAIDIDGHSAIASRYGDYAARNLVFAAGKRIQNSLRLQGADKVGFSISQKAQVYKVRADQFYILLPEVPLERARELAKHLLGTLNGKYRVNATPEADRQATSQTAGPEVSMSVRLAVLSYGRGEITGRLSAAREAFKGTTIREQDGELGDVAEVRARISRAIESALQMGRDHGGGVVVSWDEKANRLVVLPPAPPAVP